MNWYAFLIKPQPNAKPLWVHAPGRTLKDSVKAFRYAMEEFEWNSVLVGPWRQLKPFPGCPGGPVETYEFHNFPE